MKGGGASLPELRAGFIYLGIHWAFDKTEAIIQGRRVADYVFEHAFVPRPGKRKKVGEN
jgi:hypothetical protein